MPSVLGIAFDLEGTAVDVERAHHLAHFAIASELRVDLNYDNAFDKIPHFIGGPDEEVYRDLIAIAPHPEGLTVEGLLARKRHYYEQNLETMEIAPRPGFMTVLRKCRDVGLRVAIGSLTAEKQARLLLERSGIGEVFGQKNIVLRDHVENPKPAPDVFLKTAEIMCVNPENQLVFEDSPNGVRSAVAAGSRAIGMPTLNRRQTLVPLIDGGAIRIFIDWREINLLPLLENLSA